MALATILGPTLAIVGLLMVAMLARNSGQKGRLQYALARASLDKLRRRRLHRYDRWTD